MCMPELPEPFPEMGKLYFNKSNCLQEKRRHLCIRSAMHRICFTSEQVISSSSYPCHCCGDPLLVSKCRDPARFCKGERTPSATVFLKGGRSGARRPLLPSSNLTRSVQVFHLLGIPGRFCPRMVVRLLFWFKHLGRLADLGPSLGV